MADLIAAARFLATDFESPQLLIGHSLGGAAVLRAASELPAVRGVVTIGAPYDPAHIRQHLADRLPECLDGRSCAGR